MGKKIFILIVVLLVLGGGFFYWWQWQADVRELNKGLPEGVRVAKSFGGQYKVNNKKDGYVVAVPEAWKGLAKIGYSEEKDGAGLSLEGREGEARLIGVGQFKLKEELSLKTWVEKEVQALGLSAEEIPDKLKKTFKFSSGIGIIGEEDIRNLKVIKVEIEYFAGKLLYFFKVDSKIYEVGGMSEEFIREIILKSEW